MHGDLEHGRASTSDPREERKVVVAHLEFRGERAAELLELVAQSDIPSAVGRGEAPALDAGGVEPVERPADVDPVGLAFAVDQMMMAVRVRIERPEVREDVEVVAVGRRAHEMRRRVVDRSPRPGETKVVVRSGLVEVDAEVERRPKGMRETAPGVPRRLRSSSRGRGGDPAGADGSSRDRAARRIPPRDGPGSRQAVSRPSVASSCSNGSSGSPSPQGVDIDRDVLGLEERLELGLRPRSVEEDKASGTQGQRMQRP